MRCPRGSSPASSGVTGCHRNSVAVRDFRLQGFLEEGEQLITGQQGKDPDLARYVTGVVQRTKDVRQAIQVAKLCDSRKKWTGLREGCKGLE